MYQPPHFREDRLHIQHELIRRNPLGLLVTLNATGLVANHVPFVLDEAASPLGTLRVHIARPNQQWRDLDRGVDALVVFQGPEAYVTPSWYPTKRETAKVVPTWNYVVVQASGSLRIIADADWLARQIAALTRLQETARNEPWAVTDAPASYIAAQLRGIVGIEFEIAAIAGKWKASQNRPERDRQGVVAGLAAEDDLDARAMGEIVAERGSGLGR